MDAAYFWQKAATCLRLAQTLSLNNPGRISLLEMAQGFRAGRSDAGVFVLFVDDVVGAFGLNPGQSQFFAEDFCSLMMLPGKILPNTFALASTVALSRMAA